tara:strand:- start:503 stop:724 length:222 start_codon:yes stop_codon:yes gene_type:complete
MKVGDLVKWAQDDDMGIVIGIVGENGEGSEPFGADDDDAGNPIIAWFSYGFSGEPDSSVGWHDEDLHIISESR